MPQITQHRMKNKTVFPSSAADIEDTVDLHFVGGYADEAKKAHRLSMRLLEFFEQSKINFNLATLCIGPPNTRTGRSGRCEPIVGGK